MKLICDNREQEVIRAINSLIATKYKTVQLEVKQLPIADFIITDSDDTELVLIERKTVADLLASIKDNRYSEQSLRLKAHPVPNHNIIYLIEGKIYQQSGFGEVRKIDEKEESLAYSAMISLDLYKGFSVMRTESSTETANYLCNLFLKIERNKKNNESFYYSLNNDTTVDNNYLNVIKMQKKENITSENIHEIMLSQIPGISVVTASALIAKYNTLFDLINAVKSGDPDLKNIKTGVKPRKISSAVLASLTKYLA